MIRLGLTQRVEVIEDYGERRDCLDQAWTTLLESEDFQPVPLPNQIKKVNRYLESLELDGIILTSGNDLASLDNPADPAPERDRFEEAIIEYALENRVPLLGVCRGLEFLAVAFGGSLSAVDGHVAEDHQITFESSETPFSGLTFPEQATVNSYHDFGIKADDVPAGLIILGRAADGTVECVAHELHPILGIMWHPERESPSEDLDQQILNAVFQDQV